MILSEPIVTHPCGKRQLTVLKPVSDVAIICRLLFDLMGDWSTFPKSHGLNACFKLNANLIVHAFDRRELETMTNTAGTLTTTTGHGFKLWTIR